MTLGRFRVPPPHNEPIFAYRPGSPRKASLKRRLEALSGDRIEIPILIGGREVESGQLADCRKPHDHSHLLGRYHKAGTEQVQMAAAAAAEAAADWAAMPWEARAGVFLKAAEMLAGPWRDTVNAATMLGQSKTVHQAEIDAACELIDFWRFNVAYAEQVYENQPASSSGCWNYLEQRPLEGFVFAVTPFNFTSIAGNLPTAPAIMGCTVIWKPASSAVYSAYYIMKLLEEAGLPPGVINMVPGSGGQVGGPALDHPDLAGVHFTGSTEVFQGMWQQIGANIHTYRSYPRIVGETGGKDFVFAHASADVDALCTALVRGAFEFQGQKCSAASRAFIPRSLWPRVKTRLLEMVAEIKMGDPADFTNFMAAVIDRPAYDSITEYVEFARASSAGQILIGGRATDDVGYFIEPTVIETTDPDFRLLREEIFGPVLTIMPYEDSRLEETLGVCDRGSPYGLTGAVFAQDRAAIVKIAAALRNAAGNFYINDKPTGAVVGQQPFGGSRASGTNDKAGSMLNLLRWVTPRTIKETFDPPHHFGYPFMGER